MEANQIIDGGVKPPKVYRVEYWDQGWLFYCYTFESGKKTFKKVAEEKSPINLSRITLLEVRS